MTRLEKGVPIRSISRGIAVLQAINRGGTLSMMDIARTSQIPYPTACRIVQTLLFEGLIEREPARKRYRPTSLVQTLAHGFQGDARLVEAARPHIVELTRQVEWPISLATNIGHSMVIRDSTHALSALIFNQYHPGYTIPILECAAGIVYLAHTDEAERETILRAIKLLGRKTDNHAVEQFETSAIVFNAQRLGYATRRHNRFTRNPGKTSSIAVPIHHGDRVVGTLTLAFFASAKKMSDAVEIFVDPLKQCASSIATDLAVDP